MYIKDVLLPNYSSTMRPPTPTSISKTFLLIFLVSIILCSYPAFSQNPIDFLECLSAHSKNLTDVVYTPDDPSYQPVLLARLRNLRFATSSTPKPQVIVTPVDESQIQDVILCARSTGLQIRARSGGHDYEARSSVSDLPDPFIILDLINFSEININVEEKTAWVGVAVRLGQLYYRISQASRTLGFPAGTCPTVAAGGLLSGAGYGPLHRKYGLSADNVIDARIIDIEGRILDRESMGEDLFWAIRGGGAASFGIITSWKVKLVTVPETMTIFTVNRTLEQNATQLVHKWQSVAPYISDDLYMPLNLIVLNSTQQTVQANFQASYFGGVDGLLALMNDWFPELNVTRQDCTEVSWIQTALYFGGLPIDTPPENLTSSISPPIYYITRFPFKAKSDYVRDPIPIEGWEGIWDFLLEQGHATGLIAMVPYGGRTNRIAESATPFPHRAGTLIQVQYIVYWDEQQSEERNINWIRRLYRYMAPYVSKYPREAYYNYRDLDLGVNRPEGNTSYGEASVWGLKYYKNNFKRLVRVKTAVDPTDFFRNEQSIPPLQYTGKSSY